MEKNRHWQLLAALRQRKNGHLWQQWPITRRPASADFQYEAKRLLRPINQLQGQTRPASAFVGLSFPYFFSTTIFPPSDRASTLRSYMPSA